MIYSSKNMQGFSLVEVLVAISILLLVIVGPMTIISRSNNSTAFATEQIVAFFLAQEGLELVQKQRDDFLLEHFDDPVASPNPWSDFIAYFNLCNINPPYNHTNGCALQIEAGVGPDTEVVRHCDTLTNCRLRLDTTIVSPGRRRFQYDTGNPALYTRAVKMEVLSTNGGLQEVLLTSTVTWRTGTLIRTQQVVASTYLFNVYEKN